MAPSGSSFFTKDPKWHSKVQKSYSLRPIILFASVDVFRHILVVDTSVLAKSNMGRRE
jgi:hypothetical protein